MLPIYYIYGFNVLCHFATIIASYKQSYNYWTSYRMCCIGSAEVGWKNSEMRIIKSGRAEYGEYKLYTHYFTL